MWAKEAWAETQVSFRKPPEHPETQNQVRQVFYPTVTMDVLNAKHCMNMTFKDWKCHIYALSRTKLNEMRKELCQSHKVPTSVTFSAETPSKR